METQLPTDSDKSKKLPDMLVDEHAAINYFRSVRWHNGTFCPNCNSEKIYHFSDNKTHKCGDCRKSFSIKVGTIFEDSRIPLHKWLTTIWMLTSQENGISSTQLSRDISVTQKTAWFMLQRLRYAAQTSSFKQTSIETKNHEQ